MTTHGSPNRASPVGGPDSQHRGDSPRRGRGAHLRGRWQRTLTVLRAPHVEIAIYGDEDAHSVYRAFTARHPRFRVTSAKRWGVALLELPPDPAAYLTSVSRLVRRRRKAALDAGYRYAVVDPSVHLGDILAVNRSAPVRQGRAMGAKFTDPGYVASTVGARRDVHAVLDRSGQLRAYAVVLDVGEAFTFSAMIGHDDDLEAGVMYLLMVEIVRSCISSRRPDGSPRWLVYDTFWGASEGLAFFKERTGFHPRTVRWTWGGTGDASRF